MSARATEQWKSLRSTKRTAAALVNMHALALVSVDEREMSALVPTAAYACYNTTDAAMSVNAHLLANGAGLAVLVDGALGYYLPLHDDIALLACTDRMPDRGGRGPGCVCSCGQSQVRHAQEGICV